MIRIQWARLVARIDAMSLRERVMIFAAAAFLLVFAINAMFLDPLLAEQKQLALQVVQQQAKMQAVQAQLQAVTQGKNDGAIIALRAKVRQLQQQLGAGEAYLESRRDKLVPPDRMGALLEQVLNQNGRLQLVTLETLAATPLLDTPALKPAGTAATNAVTGQERQVYKHGVRLTVRGSYADLLKYLTALEKLPTQMFWGSAKMSVQQYPVTEMTLTLYTLSLDTVWLQV